MTNNDLKIPVIIPSAVDDVGISKDYFDIDHINLFPLVHKSLIKYLLDDLRKEKINSHISTIHIVINEKLSTQYNDHLKDYLKSHNTKLAKQSQNEQRGILKSVDQAVNEIKNDDYFMIIYGDTLIHNKILDRLIKAAEDLDKKENKEWCVAVFIDDSGDSELNLKKRKEKNRWGLAVVDSDEIKVEEIKRNDEIEKVRSFNQNAIEDILYHPTYTDLVFTNKKLLIESGVMIVSKELWASLKKHHNQDPMGLRSIPDSLRRQFIEDDFSLVGIIGDADDWIDINYPWEYLISNDFLAQLIGSNFKKKKRDLDLEGTGYIVVDSIDELISLLKENGINVGDFSEKKCPPVSKKYTGQYDDAEWGVDQSAIINGCLILPDPSKKENKNLNIYIGANVTINGVCVINKNVRIRNNATIVNSVLGNSVLIDTNCLVDHSVIMDNAKILVSSVVPYSIIGKRVILGGRTTIACERLRAIATAPDSNNNSYNENVNKFAKYYASSTIVRHSSRFGAIIGDRTRIGIGVNIQPGRKIGRDCNIAPGSNIVKNIPPDTVVSINDDGGLS